MRCPICGNPLPKDRCDKTFCSRECLLLSDRSLVEQSEPTLSEWSVEEWIQQMCCDQGQVPWQLLTIPLIRVPVNHDRDGT
jgi:hypothetical protein